MTSTLQSAALTAESWEHLYDFLDPVRREKAGPARDAEAEAKCQEITHKLVCFFANRGCRDAEDLAEETILRVAMKCAGVSASSPADRIGYFYGFARHVFQEWLRNQWRESTPLGPGEDPIVPSTDDPQSTERVELQHRCLERCMPRLTHRARRLVIAYHGGGEVTKIERRHRLAAEFGKSLNALRIEVHRVMKALRRCVLQCTDRKQELQQFDLMMRQ